MISKPINPRLIEKDLERMEKERELFTKELNHINTRINQEYDLLEDVQAEIAQYKQERQRINELLKELNEEYSKKRKILEQLEANLLECKLTCKFCKDPSKCTKSQKFKDRCPFKNNVSILQFTKGGKD